MSDSSPRLDLPFLLPGQAQKHVTVNEALARLDLIVQAAVTDRDRALPPAAPEEGDRHIVAPGAGGAWEGQGGRIAHFGPGGWEFVTPRPGWRVEVLSEGRAVVFDGSVWQGPEASTQRFASLGISTPSDPTNRLAVASEATLFTHAGAGHQLKLNKAGAGDTASLLYQTNWSGRAEIGLAGSDDLAVKVSADGSLWTTALTVVAATGRVAAPQGIALGAGSAAAPALGFAGDTDTGIFTPAANVLALSAGGTERARVTTAGLSVTGQISGSAVSQSAAEGTAGRLLKTGDWGLGGEGPQITGALDGVVLPGRYRVAPGAIGGPGDLAAAPFATLRVWRSGAAIAQEIALALAPAQAWTRRSLDGGAVWGPWAPVYSAGTLLGPVALSGGVPTGAVLERGQNVGGSWLRLADGTQICWPEAPLTFAHEAAGSRLAAPDWVFPLPFAAAPALMITPPVRTGAGGWPSEAEMRKLSGAVGGTATAAAATELRAWAVAGQNFAAGTSVAGWGALAVGRWD